MLVLGLIIINALTVVYISQCTNDPKQMFVILELFQWSLQSFTTLILIFSASYAIYKLNSLFANEFTAEIKYIKLILITFITSFVIMTAFYWTMFAEHSKLKS